MFTPVSLERSGLKDFSDWVKNNRAVIDQQIHVSGVLLFRGFKISSALEFRTASAAICPDLREYTGGDSPRIDVCDKVYTSSEYPSHLEVLLHNELSYAGWSPRRVFFGCLIPSESGGETHIADGRQIYTGLDKGVRELFESQGITYLQHLWDANGEPGIGKSWQQTFETEEKEIAEKYLKESAMSFQWTSRGIRTAARKQAVVKHPVTGERCWHNQADQWHRGMASVKDSVSGLATEILKPDTTSGTETLGNHATFGDGTEIDVEALQHIREVSRQHEIVFSWKQGDIMMIDNILSMHGRKPFTGHRQVLVAMA